MIGVPPLNSNLPTGETYAVWPKPWANWLTAVFSQLAYLLNSPCKTVTANYQATLADSLILINGNITVTLPLAKEAINKRITVKIINAGVGTRTVNGNGTNIDGSATWTSTTQYASADFATNETGTIWSIL
jgi:hypothetical protein